jgi:lipoprotein-releasing system permease protein
VKLSVYIAKRYLFAKKSRNAINIISAVSVAGVSVGTMALVIILSVFNGLENMVNKIFNTFDPDISITAAKGKVFTPDSVSLARLSEINGILAYSLTLEENAALRYGDRQYIASIKGVDDNYKDVTGIDSSMYDGEFILKTASNSPRAVLGIGVANYLGVSVNFITPLFIWVPRRTAGNSLNPENALNRKYIFPAGIFEIEQEFDSKYLFIPLDFCRELLEYEKEISSIEIKLKDYSTESVVRKEAEKIFGKDFVIKNRIEQQAIFYKVMRSERLAIFFILTLIIVIASFNIIGSLTMLIIEKERDIEILKSLGADNNLIRRIFIFEGWLISIIGAITGLILGFLICWLQQRFGLIRLNSESLIMQSYPVIMKLRDFIIVPVTVLLIGYWAAWYPVRYLTKKYLLKNEKPGFKKQVQG